jgi:hypothetical protein
MALSLFAAKALLRDYLNGRSLPDPLLNSVVQAVESRLIEGKMPVIHEELRRQIDSEAGELHPRPQRIS